MICSFLAVVECTVFVAHIVEQIALLHVLFGK